MKGYISTTFSEEEGETFEGKTIILRGSREELIAIAGFFSQVNTELKEGGPFHMQLRDSMPGWKKGQHVDIDLAVYDEAD